MIDYEWPGKLIYSPDKGTITWRREMAKEHKQKDDKSKMKPKKKKDCM